MTTPALALRALALCLLTATGACGRPPVEVDLVPPYVVGLTPGPAGVPVGATLTVAFSEPLASDRVYWTDPQSGDDAADSVLLGRAPDEAALVRAADSPPLSPAERKKVVATTVTLAADRRSISVTPWRPLDGRSDYVLVLSRQLADDHLNGLSAPGDGGNVTQVLAFSTAAAPEASALAQLDSPAAGAVGVPVDLPGLQVRFTQPMDDRTLSPDRIGLVDLTAHLSVPPASLSWMGTVATLTLAPDAGGGCSTLCPGHSYALFVDPSATDLAGRPVAPVDAQQQSFSAASCLRTLPPHIAPGSVAASPSDRGATVSWKTDEPAGTKVLYAAGGPDALDACLAQGSCRAATGPDATCWVDPCHPPDDDGLDACRHEVRLPSLDAATEYSFLVASADAGGREARSPAGSFTTLPPLPRLVITELFAAPEGLLDEAGRLDADAGKFVELFNADSVPVDLAPTGSGAGRQAWALARCTEPTCTRGFTNRWPMNPAGSGTVLAPGAYALAVGDAFDPGRLGVPFGTMLLQSDGGSRTLLGNGLTKGTAATYALLAPGDVVVSTYAGWLGRPDGVGRAGHSFARTDPAAADLAPSWALSSREISSAPGNFATPGAPNGS